MLDLRFFLHFFKTEVIQNFNKDSNIFIHPFKSTKAISGSIIKNSEACVVVLDFSALKVGEKVKTFFNASTKASTCNWPDTVKKESLLKKFLSFTKTLKFSPAPSASLLVIIGL